MPFSILGLVYHYIYFQLLTFSVLKFISNKSAPHLFFGDFGAVNVSSASLLQLVETERV